MIYTLLIIKNGITCLTPKSEMIMNNGMFNNKFIVFSLFVLISIILMILIYITNVVMIRNYINYIDDFFYMIYLNLVYITILLVILIVFCLLLLWRNSKKMSRKGLIMSIVYLALLLTADLLLWIFKW